MKIVYKNNLGELINIKNYFPSIDFMTSKVIKLLDMFSALNLDNEVLTLLKTFNKHISEFSSKDKIYKVDINGETISLGFDSLSSGERLFVLCYIVHSLQIVTLFQNEYDQLDAPHIRLFYKLWANSQYINIVSNKSLKVRYGNELIKRNIVQGE